MPQRARALARAGSKCGLGGNNRDVRRCLPASGRADNACDVQPTVVDVLKARKEATWKPSFE
eukprot:11165686-Lingulodinium_polyedra.AAC.1